MNVFWFEPLILIFYLLSSICVPVWVNLDFKALAINGTDRLWNPLRSRLAGFNQMMFHMEVNTMFPNTLPQKGLGYVKFH